MNTNVTPQLTITVPAHMVAAMQAVNPHALVVAQPPQLPPAPRK